MAKVILRQKAIDALNNIWTYTFLEWSEKQADKYYENIEFAFVYIEKNRERRGECNSIRNNLFGLRIGEHATNTKTMKD